MKKENGEKIGRVQLEEGWYSKMGKEIKLLDADNSVLLNLIPSKGLLGASYGIMDSNNNLIGNVSGNLKKTIMNDSKGNEILSVKKTSSFTIQMIKGEFEINYTNGYNIAKFSIKPTKVKNGLFFDSYTCTLEINYSNFDRRTILGLLISFIMIQLIQVFSISTTIIAVAILLALSNLW